MVQYPLRLPAIRIEQPLGIFYAVSVPVEALLQATFSEKVRAYQTGDGTYGIDGAQRLQKQERLDDIAKYINRDDSNFPNSIILAANYREDGRFEGDALEEAAEIDESARRWEISTQIVETPNEPSFEVNWLTIPTGDKLAAVIDGQHRLFAFAKAKRERLETELLCAVYMDLPKPLQAQVFAIINSTQKPVPKSLTYELFGYNVEDEEERFWSPDKLAVLLTRRLAVETDSPLAGNIIVAPENSFASASNLTKAAWKVSFATIVAGIVRLFSSNPKEDSNLLMTPRRTRQTGPGSRKDNSPLRAAYLEENDKLIYDTVRNYLEACDNLFWSQAGPGSFIGKTVGVQALLDVMRELVREGLDQEDLRASFFAARLSKASHIKFDHSRFNNPSGSGRSFIRRLLLANLGLRYTGEIAPEDSDLFVR